MKPTCPNAAKWARWGVACAIPEHDGVLCFYCAAVENAKRGASNLIDDRDDNSDGWSRGRADCE